MISLLLEWLLELWVVIWHADERVGGQPRRWPWVVGMCGAGLLVVVWALEYTGLIPW